MSEPWDDEVATLPVKPEIDYERDLTEEEIEELRNEERVEKAIQPMGFVPSDEVEVVIGRAIKNGTVTPMTPLMAGFEDYQAELATIHAWLKTNRPSRYFIPNIGQEKAILPLKDVDPDEPCVLKGVFGGANMVGKTTMLVNFMAGVIWGRAEMNEFFADWKIFEKFEKIRKLEKRALRLRIICHSGGMEDGGQVMEEITAWWPKGLYKWEKNHKAYYSVCKCFDMDGKLLAVINVRTHDQPRNAHAGHTLDGIFGDEPLPKPLWAENHARLRQKLGGILWLFLSPLDEASWIQDMLVNDPSVYFTQAMIWDNCSNWHPDARMWSSGVVGKGQVLTRGTRDKSIFLAQIRAWEQEGPEIARARAYGEFTHFAGSVFKEFDAAKHVIKAFPIPASWPVYQIVDPHDGRPHFSLWIAHGQELGQDRFYAFSVTPNTRWDKVKGGQAIPEACQLWRIRENRFRGQIALRGGDPQKLKSPVAGKTLSSQGIEFANEGFAMTPADNDISVGISRIRDALRNGRLFIMDCCPYSGESNENLTQAFAQFCYKSSANESSANRNGETLFVATWKDPIDCFRYFFSLVKPWAPVTAQRSASPYARKSVASMARPWIRR